MTRSRSAAEDSANASAPPGAAAETNVSPVTRPRRAVAVVAAWITGAGLFVMLTFLSIVWMRPLLYSDGELRQEIFREYGTRIQAHTAAVRDGVATRPLLIALTPLVDVEITVVPFAAVPDVSRGTPAPTPLSRERYRLHRDFQWEIYVAVLLSMAFIISLVYNASELFAAGRRTTHIVTAPLRQPGPDADASLSDAGTQSRALKAVEDVFTQDVQWLHARADELNRWSILFLLGGLLTSVMGIIAFFLFAPRTELAGGTPEALLAALRPTALLLFFEGLAFFLLRQHKALIREHGRLIALILRRNNWIAVCRLLAAGALADPAGGALLTALSGEVIRSMTDEEDAAAANATSLDAPVVSKWLNGVAGQAGGTK